MPNPVKDSYLPSWLASKASTTPSLFWLEANVQNRSGYTETHTCEMIRPGDGVSFRRVLQVLL